MTVLEEVKELVNGISPQCICDDCITQKLDLTVRQHANHKTRELAGYTSLLEQNGVAPFVELTSSRLAPADSPKRARPFCISAERRSTHTI